MKQKYLYKSNLRNNKQIKYLYKMSNLEMSNSKTSSRSTQSMSRYFSERKRSQDVLRDRLVPAICEENFFAQSFNKNPKCKLSPVKYQKALESITFTRTKSIFDYNIKNNPETQSIVLQKNTQTKTIDRFKNDIKPFKVVEIKGWSDNFYSDLLDWSNKNYIGIGTREAIYLYNPYLEDSQIGKKHRILQNMVGCNQAVTSLSFSPYENKLALGYNSGVLKIYDCLRERFIAIRNIHKDRIGAIQWRNHLYTGSKDRKISMYDAKANKSNLYLIHNQQVIGVRQNDHFVASGGNDNVVNIYDFRKPKVIDSYSHKAAVKGLCWSRNKKILYSGGGTSDKTIKIWQNGEGVKKTIDTGSQICKMLYSKNSEQFITCHGYSLNQINVWDESGKRLATLNGHTSRVLYAAISPNGQNLITGAGDQSLKFWNLFSKREEQNDVLTSNRFEDIR